MKKKQTPRQVESCAPKLAVGFWYRHQWKEKVVPSDGRTQIFPLREATPSRRAESLGHGADPTRNTGTAAVFRHSSLKTPWPDATYRSPGMAATSRSADGATLWMSRLVRK